MCYHYVFLVFALKVEACFGLRHSCFSEMHGVSTLVNSIPSDQHRLGPAEIVTELLGYCEFLLVNVGEVLQLLISVL